MLFSTNSDLILKNFKAIVDKINFFLRNQRFNYFINFENNKSRVIVYSQINFLKFITKLIIFYALTQIWKQQKKIKITLTKNE